MAKEGFVARIFFDTIRYGASYARLLLTHPSGFHVPPMNRHDRDMAHAVLLIPGFLGNRSVLSPLETRFERSGVPAFSVNHGVYSAMSFGIAKEIAWSRIALLRERYPRLKSLDLVGHSMGGLIALGLIDDPVCMGLRLRLVTLGTPFHGTWAALLGCAVSRSAWQLLPFNRPRPRLFDVSVDFLSIAGDVDVLAPPARCRHPDADNVVVRADHAGLLFRKHVFQTISAFLAPA